MLIDDNAANSTRVALSGSARLPFDPAGTTRAVPRDESVAVSVVVQRNQPLNLDALCGRHLDHENYAARHGADPVALERVRAFAEASGLTVDESRSSALRRTVALQGSAEAMQQAFGVDLLEHTGETGTHRVCRGNVHLPAECAAVVEAVLGLDTRPQVTPYLRHVERNASTDTPAEPVSFTPDEVADLYNFPVHPTGVGQTIALIELGGGFSASDLAVYFTHLGLWPPTVHTVSVDGAVNAPGDPQGADGEVMLDIEVVGAVAPGATIAVYFAPNTERGFLDAVTSAIHEPIPGTTQRANIISISWGAPEPAWTRQAMLAMDAAFQSAAALGITVLVAAGDNGSSDGVVDGRSHVDFPASSPHVLACGGTTLDAIDGLVVSETVWNELPFGDGATGGGVSAVFLLPAWQQHANVPHARRSAAGRGVPDVAGNADPKTGYQVMVGGQFGVLGGTSAVAPLWAGLVARMNQMRGKPLGFLNPALYTTVAGKAFRDVTQGNNGAFKAGPGWDPCVGLGSPDGAKLAQALGVPSVTR